jgi:hypothetical protein
VASQLDQLVSGSVSWISFCFFEFCLASFFFGEKFCWLLSFHWNAT